MTFSSKVKYELCGNEMDNLCCAIAESYGCLLLGNTFSAAECRLVTANNMYAKRLPPLFKKAFGVAFDSKLDGKGKTVFAIRNPEKTEIIWETYGYGNTNDYALHLNNAMVSDACCLSAFWRGAFLSGGSVSDPGKNYHLEIVTPHAPLFRELTALLHECSLEPKSIARSGVHVLYFKSSKAIESFLAFIGASESAEAVKKAKMEKHLRNRVNRAVNCETGNVGKTVEAAVRQCDFFNRLIAAGIFESFPEHLKTVVTERLEHPEDSLSELADRLKISKSALNHRLRKLEALKDDIFPVES